MPPKVTKRTPAPVAKKTAKKKPATKPAATVQYRTNRYMINLAGFPKLPNGAVQTDKPHPLLVFLDVHNITDGIGFAHFNTQIFGQCYALLSKKVGFEVDNTNSVVHLCSLLDTYQQQGRVKDAFVVEVIENEENEE